MPETSISMKWTPPDSRRAILSGGGSNFKPRLKGQPWQPTLESRELRERS
jgi:hypothetical protein